MNTQRQQVNTSIRSSFTPVLSGLLQRKCACGSHKMGGGECAECSEKTQPLLRTPFTPRGRDIEGEGEIPAIAHEVLNSPGQPLDPATRAFFELRFGHDFSRVRVHVDTKAAESARAVSARAYTVGPDIVFGSGQYVLATSAGKQLLAHELTHVLQQSHAHNRSRLMSRVSQPSDAAEVEADKIASEITNRPPLPTSFDFAGRASSTLNTSTYAQPQVIVSPTVMHRRARPWPLNGYVINNSAEPVTVWSDSQGLYTIGPGATSGRFTEDVDHIRDKYGQWYKIGVNTVTVDATGVVSGYSCRVSNYGGDCT